MCTNVFLIVVRSSDTFVLVGVQKRNKRYVSIPETDQDEIEGSTRSIDLNSADRKCNPMHRLISSSTKVILIGPGSYHEGSHEQMRPMSRRMHYPNT